MSVAELPIPSTTTVLPARTLGRPVVVGVDLLARERLAARERRLRPARVPVVTVGDQDVVVVPGLDRPGIVAATDRHVPAAALACATLVTSVRKVIASRSPKWSTKSSK